VCLQKIEQWVLHLPKTLWELGDTDIPCTEVIHVLPHLLDRINHEPQVILRFLLRLFQRGSPLAHSNASVSYVIKLDDNLSTRCALGRRTALRPSGSILHNNTPCAWLITWAIQEARGPSSSAARFGCGGYYHNMCAY
jgi:hypothetical protein